MNTKLTAIAAALLLPFAAATAVAAGSDKLGAEQVEKPAKAEEEKADPKAAKAAKEAKPGEPERIHSDPRFKGKVKVIGATSEDFGSRPESADMHSSGVDLDSEDAAPKALPLAPPPPMYPAQQKPQQPQKKTN